MKKTFALITLFMCCTLTQAQRLSLNTGAGIIGSTGPISDDFRKASANHTHITGDLGLVYNTGNWQAGIGCQVFNMSAKTRFVFEQDILPDRSTHLYSVAMGRPMYCPYITGSYNYRVSDAGYIFAGARAGMMFSGQQTPSPYPYYYGYNDNGDLMLPVSNSLMYGLQAGFMAHASERLSAGAVALWQQAKATSDISYRTFYNTKGNNNLTAQPIIVEQRLDYMINMYSVQVFMRFTLFAKPEPPAETVDAETE